MCTVAYFLCSHRLLSSDLGPVAFTLRPMKPTSLTPPTVRTPGEWFVSVSCFIIFPDTLIFEVGPGGSRGGSWVNCNKYSKLSNNNMLEMCHTRNQIMKPIKESKSAVSVLTACLFVKKYPSSEK